MHDTTRGASGVLIAAAGAVSYGVTVVVGRSLAGTDIGSATALGTRFAIAGVILLGVLALRRAPLRPLPGEWLRIVALGAVGYTTESTLFYLSLQRGSAAACALLFYAYPALVMLLELARGRERPTRLTVAALGLSVAGTATVVAAGSNVSISAAGCAFALGSAAVYAVYLLVGRELGRRSDAMTAACWVAFGAAGSSLVRGLVTGALRDPTSHAGQLLLYGIATALAFAFTFAALSRIGTARTAVVMTLEAVSAAILAATFLGESITVVQGVGGLAVLVAAAIIARASPTTSGDEPVAALGEAAGACIESRGVRLGIADHYGWAIAVTAGAQNAVVDRRRLELIETEVPNAPVEHALTGLDDDQAAALVADVRASVVRATTTVLDELCAALPAPVTSISLRHWPDDFPLDIATLRRAPYNARADSVMYRQVLADLAHERGWPVHLYDAKAVEAQAERLAGDVLHAPRAVLGAPWGKDHRVALAATIVAGSA